LKLSYRALRPTMWLVLNSIIESYADFPGQNSGCQRPGAEAHTEAKNVLKKTSSKRKRLTWSFVKRSRCLEGKGRGQYPQEGWRPSKMRGPAFGGPGQAQGGWSS